MASRLLLQRLNDCSRREKDCVNETRADESYPDAFGRYDVEDLAGIGVETKPSNDSKRYTLEKLNFPHGIGSFGTNLLPMYMLVYSFLFVKRHANEEIQGIIY